MQKITSRFLSVLPIEDTLEVNRLALPKAGALEVNRLARYGNDKLGRTNLEVNFSAVLKLRKTVLLFQPWAYSL